LFPVDSIVRDRLFRIIFAPIRSLAAVSRAAGDPQGIDVTIV
jgi:hypothetical protein